MSAPVRPSAFFQLSMQGCGARAHRRCPLQGDVKGTDPYQRQTDAKVTFASANCAVFVESHECDARLLALPNYVLAASGKSPKNVPC